MIELEEHFKGRPPVRVLVGSGDHVSLVTYWHRDALAAYSYYPDDRVVMHVKYETISGRTWWWWEESDVFTTWF